MRSILDFEPPVHVPMTYGQIRARRSTLRWPKEGKYNRVQRALPYPDRGEKGCRWKSVTTPSGRKMQEPIQ